MQRDRAAISGGFLLSAALFLGGLFLYHWPETRGLVGDERYYHAVAERLARGLPVQENPLWPPLYPRLLALGLWAAPGSLLAIQLLQGALWLGSAALLHGVARALFSSRAAIWGVTFGVLWLLDLVAYTQLLWPEVPHLFFLSASLYAAIAHGERAAGAVSSGVLLGLALLLKLVLLPIAGLLAVFVAVVGEAPPQRRIRNAALLLLATFVTTLPVTLAQMHEHGRFQIADSGGLNLWLGVHERPWHQGRVRESTQPQRVALFADFEAREGRPPSVGDRQDLLLADALATLRGQGLSATFGAQFPEQYTRLLDREGDFTRRLVDDPLNRYRLAGPTLRKALHAAAHAGWFALLAAAALGIATLRWQRPQRPGWEHFFALLLIYAAVLFFFVLARPRFLMAFLPALLLLGGAFIEAVDAHRKGRSTSRFRLTPLRLGLGLGLAAVLILASLQAPTPAWWEAGSPPPGPASQQADPLLR
jgi:hypothetical protein